MYGVLPWFFVFLAAGALLSGIYLFWESLRAALGASEPLEVQATAEADTRRRLLERKEALLNNLRDLKFDYDGGKISDTDFELLDTKLRAQTKAVLRLLDEDVAPLKQRAEDMISERLVAAGRDPYRAAPPVGPRVDDEALDDDEAAKADADASEESAKADERPAEEAAKADGSDDRVECPSCETPNEPDAVFCKKCGTRVGGDDAGESAAEGEGA